MFLHGSCDVQGHLYEGVLELLEPAAWKSYMTSPDCNPSIPKVEDIKNAHSDEEARVALASANTAGGDAWRRGRREVARLITRQLLTNEVLPARGQLATSIAHTIIEAAAYEEARALSASSDGGGSSNLKGKHL